MATRQAEHPTIPEDFNAELVDILLREMPDMKDEIHLHLTSPNGKNMAPNPAAIRITENNAMVAKSIIKIHISNDDGRHIAGATKIVTADNEEKLSHNAESLKHKIDKCDDTPNKRVQLESIPTDESSAINERNALTEKLAPAEPTSEAPTEGEMKGTQKSEQLSENHPSELENTLDKVPPIDEKDQANSPPHENHDITRQSVRPLDISSNEEDANAPATPMSPELIRLTKEEEARDQHLRTSGEVFLQHLPCFKLQMITTNEDVYKCRECLHRNTEVSAWPSDVYCRFYEFRRLQYSNGSDLKVCGFPNPFVDPAAEDVNIWQPDEHTAPTAGFMDIQVCRYILLHVGDQFCYLWRQEAEALELHENPNTAIAWKKLVQGIREICDVCDTTLFNYHWTCDKCGFSVCIDCFRDRKKERICPKLRLSNKSQRGRDEFYWLLCTASQSQPSSHTLSGMMLTQIIAGNALNILGQMLHDVRSLWEVPQICGCLLSNQAPPVDHELRALVQDMIKDSQLKQRTSASSLATKETVRLEKEMIKRHIKKVKFARNRGVYYIPGRIWLKEELGEDLTTTAFDKFKNINFLREGLAGLRRFLPPLPMTLAQSKMLVDVPHEWLCDGKLLRLTNPVQPDNRLLFQEVWKCGQPVMISEVARSLNLDLWRPEAFCRDFGDKPNDLINCLNGNLVPNQPMRHFWEGFQCIKKRLVDAHGEPMLLKLKDWPPGDDFAEILPTRYADLMRGLPMPEYTLRTGNLNIASCLPKMFVPPDLGPKMYNAYGSALHPDKGTTNLHLDISDAVNIMVYVGIPQDTDGRSQVAATERAITMAGCDYLTHKRSLNMNPGALWHIFAARDADKIRDLLHRVTLEKGYRLEPDHDPIHDQNWYLDDELRARLFNEYGVEGYPILQCLGDAVFIPAGAPHQVQNLYNCIKVAEDFVSPENITHCYHLTHEFRRLSHSHTNHEDKLQIKNIIYHAIKDCCTILMRSLEKRVDEEIAVLKKKKIDSKVGKNVDEAKKKEMGETTTVKKQSKETLNLREMKKPVSVNAELVKNEIIDEADSDLYRFKFNASLEDHQYQKLGESVFGSERFAVTEMKVESELPPQFVYSINAMKEERCGSYAESRSTIEISSTEKSNTSAETDQTIENEPSMREKLAQSELCKKGQIIEENKKGQIIEEKNSPTIINSVKNQQQIKQENPLQEKLSRVLNEFSASECDIEEHISNTTIQRPITQKYTPQVAD